MEDITIIQVLLEGNRQDIPQEDQKKVATCTEHSGILKICGNRTKWNEHVTRMKQKKMAKDNPSINKGKGKGKL